MIILVKLIECRRTVFPVRRSIYMDRETSYS